VHVGEIVDNGAFVPWIRLWAPDGKSLGRDSGESTAQISATAEVTGRYLVLVASGDNEVKGAGTCSLRVDVSP
jgi:hypothetical protein